MSVTVEKCIQAWTNSLRQLNAKADIVFFGDSLTYYGNFATVFPDKVVCNLGLRGDTIQGMINRVEQVKMLEPKQVFLMAGINDVESSAPGCFKRKYDELIQLIRTSNPSASLVIYSMLPVNNNRFPIGCNNDQISVCNKFIGSIAKKSGLPFVDIFSLFVKNGIMPIEFTRDGIHLTELGYKKWYSIIRIYYK